MTFTIVQNDTAPPISSRLSDSGEVVDLSNVSNVRFHMEDEFKNLVVDADLTGRVNIVNDDLGVVEYVFKPEDTSDVGSYDGEWQVLYDDGKVETFPSRGKVNIEIVEEIE
jgi:hypothetical protein